MTTTRRYSCNLCHDEITDYVAQEGARDAAGRAGAGMYFTPGADAWARFVHPRDAEHHVCERCIRTIKDAKEIA